jgi:hypothetical protein
MNLVWGNHRIKCHIQEKDLLCSSYTHSRDSSSQW